MRFKYFKIDFFIATLVVLGCISVIFLLPMQFNFDSMFNPVTRTLQDFDMNDVCFSKFRDNEAIPLDTNIILVNIGRIGELDRNQIAKLVETVNKFEPKVVAIDAFFRADKGPASDSLLERVLSETKNLVLVAELANYNEDKDQWDTVKLSNPKFTTNAVFGFANLITGKEKDSLLKTVRLFPPKYKTKDSVMYAFEVEIARKFSPESVKKLMARKNNVEFINYRGDLSKFPQIEFESIFEPEADFSMLKDKIVLFGYFNSELETNYIFEDHFYTPLNSRYVGKALPDMAGAVIHANILSMIINQNYLIRVANSFVFFLAFMICYTNFYIFTFIRKRFENWFETVTYLIFIIEAMLITFININLFHYYNISLNINILVGTSALSVPFYEIYYDSIKPLSIRAYNKIVNLFKKIKVKK